MEIQVGNKKHVMLLHDRIFGSHPKYSNQEMWSEKEKNHGLKIYTTENGFVTTTYYGEDENGRLHIWLCGVEESHRQNGIFKKIMEKIFEENKGKYKFMSLFTNPEKFPNMFGWAQKNHFGFTHEDINPQTGQIFMMKSA